MATEVRGIKKFERPCLERPSTGMAEASIRGATPQPKGTVMELILWIVAVVLVVSGIAALLRKQIPYGLALIVVGLLVGPGGVSIFT